MKKNIKSTYHSVGKKKRAIARLYMRSGNGHIIINKINYKQYYLNNIFLINKMLYPFVLTNTLNKFDLNINVYGGGHKGQIDAICLAISNH